MLLALLLLAQARPTPTPAASPAATYCTQASGQTNIFSALNRPTIGYSPCPMQPRETLLELGYGNQNDGAGRAVTLPQGFLRFGAGKDAELDFIGPAWERTTNPRASGFQDSGIGAKIALARSGSSALGADVLLTYPSGSPDFTVGAPAQTLNLDYAASLSSHLGVAATLGATRTHGLATDGTVDGFESLLPSVSLSEQANANAQVFAEAYAQSRTRPDGGALFGLDGGAQLLLAPHTEFDVEAGRTRTDRQSAHFYGFGFGFYF